MNWLFHHFNFLLREVQFGSTQLVEEHGPIPTGSAIAQKAPSLLKCKYIIHAIGPIYQDVNELKKILFLISQNRENKMKKIY